MSQPRPMTQREYGRLRDLAHELIADGVEPGTIIDAIEDEIDEPAAKERILEITERR